MILPLRKHLLFLVSLSFFARILTAAEAPADKDEGEVKSGPLKGPMLVRMEMTDGLRFEPPRFSATPGQEVTVELKNTDSTHQSHNFSVLKPGTRQAYVQQALALGENGTRQSFIPDSSDLIVHSSLVEPDKDFIVKFKMPPAPGIYPYVCTFPGHGMVMYGAIYSGVSMPRLAKDTNIPLQSTLAAIPGGGRRPYVQRIFMPDAGPAAIAVALPGKENFCWDAGICRLRYVWFGDFIDASAHWKGNGKALAVVPSAPWWSTGKPVPPILFGGKPASSPKFLGYTVSGGNPEFHWRSGVLEVSERLTANASSGAVEWNFSFTNPPAEVSIDVGAGDGAATCSVGRRNGKVLSIPASQAAKFTVHLEPSAAAIRK